MRLSDNQLILVLRFSDEIIVRREHSDALDLPNSTLYQMNSRIFNPQVASHLEEFGFILVGLVFFLIAGFSPDYRRNSSDDK